MQLEDQRVVPLEIKSPNGTERNVKNFFSILTKLDASLYRSDLLM